MAHGPISCWDGQESGDCPAWVWETHGCFENIWPNAYLIFIFSNIALSIKLLHYLLKLHRLALYLKPADFKKLVLDWPQITTYQGPPSKTSSFPANLISVDCTIYWIEITFVSNVVPSTAKILNPIFWNLVRINLLKFWWFCPPTYSDLTDQGMRIK